MKPLVSIILPAKNAELFIDETLHSIANQSYRNWECICVNDNSIDHTLHIISNWASKDPRIKALDNISNSGVISALQLGYKSSIGKLITRMDADDLMPKDKLSSLVSALLEQGEGHVSTGKVEYFHALGEGFLKYEKWLNGLIDEQNHWSHIYKECVIASPNWMMHRTDFENIGAFNSDIYPEDYELVFRMYAAKMKVVSVNKVTHLWRDHAERASRTSDLYTDNRFLPLKLSFWKTQEYVSDKVSLIGAGKKGKAIAKELQRLDIPFNWHTNNLKKIGHDIYGVKLKSLDVRDLIDSKTLVAVSSPPELNSLEEELSSLGFALGEDYWVLV